MLLSYPATQRHLMFEMYYVVTEEQKLGLVGNSAVQYIRITLAWENKKCLASFRSSTLQSRTSVFEERHSKNSVF